MSRFFLFFFGGIVKIGTLVQVINVYHPSKKGAMGIIVDRGVHHDGEWKYEILFPSGHKSWWTKHRLEVLCK